jgi:hypothetical protein
VDVRAPRSRSAASTCADHKDRIFRWPFETSDVIPWQQDARIDRSLFAAMTDD